VTRNSRCDLVDELHLYSISARGRAIAGDTRGIARRGRGRARARAAGAGQVTLKRSLRIETSKAGGSLGHHRCALSDPVENERVPV
jgi:hypothetical protein